MFRKFRAKTKEKQKTTCSRKDLFKHTVIISVDYFRLGAFMVCFSNSWGDREAQPQATWGFKADEIIEAKHKSWDINLANWVGGLAICFLPQGKKSHIAALGFNIMSIYMCIVSIDSYSRMRVSLTLLQPHSVADVKMKNLHVCIFCFSCVVSTIM